MRDGPRRRKSLLSAVLLGLVAGLVAVVLHLSGATARWENLTWDWRARWLARPAASSDNIAMILIDQASLDWGWCENNLPWPWPREVYVPILAFCRRAGVRSVAFDIIFSEPSRQGVWDDEQLGDAIAADDDFIGAIHVSHSVRQARCGAEARGALAPPGWPIASVPGLPSWLAQHPDVRATAATAPIPEVAGSATVLGNVADEADGDGVFRRSTLLRVLDERLVPSLGLASFLVGEGLLPAVVDSSQQMTLPLSLEGNVFEVAGHRVHLDDRGRAILRFRSETGSVTSYSAAAVIQSELRLMESDALIAAGQDKEAAAVQAPVISPAALADRHVILAGSAPGLLDLRPTPLDAAAPGAVIHATVLDNLLAGDFMRPAAPVAVVLVTLVLGVLAALATTTARGARRAVATTAIALPLPALLGIVGYQAGFWWPMVPGLLATTGGLAAGLIVAYATEGRQRRFLRSAFGHYLSPAVISRLLQNPDRLRLGGTRRELTIIFSDLAGFTSLSETLPPEDLTTLLNDYLSEMTDIILAEGGTLDKYEGDAIIAFWNAPLDQVEHAARACRAAVKCQHRLAEMRPVWRERCGRDLVMRIGVHTGQVIVGNLGSRQRFDYTVLGDTANLASRLEGANKFFGTGILISDATRHATTNALSVPAHEIGLVQVVGRETPVRVFTLDERSARAVDACQQALALCADGKAREAAKILVDHSSDPFAERFAERCRHDPGFKGLWRLQEK